MLAEVARREVAPLPNLEAEITAPAELWQCRTGDAPAHPPVISARRGQKLYFASFEVAHLRPMIS
jgi:hypothetical protein